jgi:hypothetical protein
MIKGPILVISFQLGREQKFKRVFLPAPRMIAFIESQQKENQFLRDILKSASGKVKF